MVEAISAVYGSQIKLSVLPLSSCYYCLAPVEVQ